MELRDAETTLDDTKVLCEYWCLKNDPDVKVIGTELQCHNLFTFAIILNLLLKVSCYYLHKL